MKTSLTGERGGGRGGEEERRGRKGVEREEEERRGKRREREEKREGRRREKGEKDEVGEVRVCNTIIQSPPSYTQYCNKQNTPHVGYIILRPCRLALFTSLAVQKSRENLLHNLMCVTSR